MPYPVNFILISGAKKNQKEKKAHNKLNQSLTSKRKTLALVFQGGRLGKFVHEFWAKEKAYDFVASENEEVEA